MADDASVSPLVPSTGPDPAALLHYIEEMLLELAQLAASAGEPALAASLAISTIQAGAAADRLRVG